MKALSAKGKLGYIDGTIKRPTNASDLAHWTRCDDLVGSWISNSVDPEIRSSTQNFPSAYEQWLEIKSRFSHHNAPKLYAIQQSIALLKQENLSVAMYYTRLKSLWDQLDAFRPIEPCICGAAEPKSFSQAIQCPKWRAAMSKEILALQANNTWVEVDLPPGKTAIG